MTMSDRTFTEIMVEMKRVYGATYARQKSSNAKDLRKGRSVYVEPKDAANLAVQKYLESEGNFWETKG